MTVEEHDQSSNEVEGFSVFPSLDGGENEGEEKTECAAGHWRRRVLPHAARSAIASLGSENPGGVFQTLIALWSVLLSRYTNAPYAKIWIRGGAWLSQRLLLMATSLDDEITFCSLLHPERWSVVGGGGSESRSQEGPSNTGVVLTQPAEEKRDGQGPHIASDMKQVEEACQLFWTVQEPSRLDGPLVELLYREGFLSDGAAAMLVQQMEALASAVRHNTNQCIRDLSSPSQQDLDRFMEWNKEPVKQEDPVSMHVRIRDVSSATPDKAAIHAWDGILTYSELDSLVSHVADRLISAGIGPGDLVPICFSKSRWGVVAMLAINRAGAAFVALDPALQTKQQQREILQQLDATVAICGSAQAADLVALGVVEKVVVLCDETIAKAAPGKAREELRQTSLLLHQGPAYLLFTSGSTGKPKGCVVSQSAFAGIVAHAPKLGITPASRALQFSSWTFAISIIEIFCTLGVGGTVCIPSDDDRRDRLSQAMTELRVNWTNLTPTVLRTLTPGAVPSLATVVISGEPLPHTLLQAWAPSVRLMPAYGLSEWSGMFSVCEPVVPGKLRVGHIGRPVNNGKTWIVDPRDHNRLLPIGSTGELVISGPNLADGYLSLPDKTAAAFVTRPEWALPLAALSSGEEPSRYYKTGDLVRYNLDGSLVHCGRKDYQAKVRGIRVDLPAVEAAVFQHFPMARESLADVVNDRLVVFVLQEYLATDTGREEEEVLCAPTSGFLVQANATRERLQESLASFMVPSIFFPVHYFPRTRTGKSDRNRLRLLVGSLSPAERLRYRISPQSRSDSDKPRSQAEVTLSQIWTELLGIPNGVLGPDSDFIALGGDSVIAMRVVDMARTAGLFSLGVQDILTFPRLSDLAARARSIETLRDQDGRPSSLVSDTLKQACVTEARKKWTWTSSNNEVQVADVLPTTGMQSLYVHHAGLDSFCFYMPRAVDLDRLREACRAVVRRHAVLRTIFTQTDAGLFQIILRDLDLPLQCVETSEEDLETWFHTSFCGVRTTGPNPALHLDRPTVAFTWASNTKKGGQYDYAFVVQLSHSQHDGLSIPVLFHDLGVAYTDATRLVPPIAPSFGDYLYCRASSGRTKSAHEFWTSYLEGASFSMPETQAQRPHNSPVASTCTSSENLPVMASVTMTLPSPSASHPPMTTGVTLGTVVRAAWAYVLSHATGRTDNDDVVFGQVVGSRTLPLNGIDQVLGPCNNIIPCRVRWSRGDRSTTVREYLERVHEDYIRTLQYDYVELGDVLKTAAAGADWPQRGPLIGSIFVHQNIKSEWAVTFGDVRSSSCVPYFRLRQTSDIWVISVPRSTSGLDLMVISGERLLTESECRCLAEQLAYVVRAFLGRPDVALASVEIPSGDECKEESPA
ncbi:nonribosomal peptide synthase [Aspergillus ustus]|uniref:Nonribosomal peptide synthase n=1 Tax=Aspergillus ustus TaxID=40382 RepID=A0A0C1E1E5_ASPUT|nr:nonribosomal peptide synthase [Aspergillus ustus]